MIFTISRYIAQALCLVLLSSSTASAFRYGLDFLNPKVYRSPNWEFSLKVEPTDMLGGGKGIYQVTQKGKAIWSGELPFTLWDAFITDNGLVAGYAYSQGVEGFARQNSSDWGDGDFVIAFIQPTGEVKKQHVIGRKRGRELDGKPKPLARGSFGDMENDRYIIRVDSNENSRDESWWVYSLSTGDLLQKIIPGDLMPDPEPARFIIDAKPIPKTNLTLVHWWRYFDGNAGARFTLINLQGKPIWTLDLDRDYNIPGNEKAEYEIQDFIRKNGAILDATNPFQFEILFAAGSKRVTFSVKSVGKDEWIIKEISRRDYVFQKEPEQTVPSFPERPLKFLGSFLLQRKQSPTTPVIRDVHSFSFDEQGRICLLRARLNERPALVLLDQQGIVIKEILIDEYVQTERSKISNIVWIGESRFLVASSDQGIGGKAMFWISDFDTGKARQIDEIESPPIDVLAGYPDGCFVAITSARHKYSSIDGLYFFNSNGENLWKITNNEYHGDPEDVLSPEDIAIDQQGNIAVLDNVRNSVQFYDKMGNHLRIMKLEHIWKRRPHLRSISTYTGGEFVIYDYNGKPPGIHIDTNGVILNQFDFAYLDGRKFFPRGGIKTSPDGRLWISDGYSLARLTDDGRTDLVVGDALNYDELNNMPDSLFVDMHDQIYVPDDRTLTFHTFNRTGEFINLYKPDPGDFPRMGSAFNTHIAVSDSGDVYISLDSEVCRYLHFSPQGKRLGVEKLDLDPTSEKWYFHHGTGNRWVIGYREFYLVDRSGKVIRTISKRPDGNWLESIENSSMAPDGSIAVLAIKLGLKMDDATINIYNNDGDPVGTIKFPSKCSPFARIAYNGNFLFIRGEEQEIYILDNKGNPVQKFIPREKDLGDSYLGPYIASKGTEFWLFNNELEYFRYLTPQ